jgi:superfamily I DNA/RNA helicase
VRQQSVLQPDDEDMRKLQPLATMHGDERDGVAGIFLFFFALGVERDVFEKGFEAGGGASPAERLGNFLEEITLDTEREEEEENTGDAVTLITMHSCKGLEFPHVFIVGLEDGLLPHSRSKAEGTLDEERRLFYVAVTRAMQTLTISHCGGRKKYGQVLPCHPSPFLKELPEELVEHSGSKSKTPVEQESGKNLFAAMRQAVT